MRISIHNYIHTRKQQMKRMNRIKRKKTLTKTYTHMPLLLTTIIVHSSHTSSNWKNLISTQRTTQFMPKKARVRTRTTTDNNNNNHRTNIYTYILCKRHMHCLTISMCDPEFSLIHLSSQTHIQIPDRSIQCSTIQFSTFIWPESS